MRQAPMGGARPSAKPHRRWGGGPVVRAHAWVTVGMRGHVGTSRYVWARAGTYKRVQAHAGAYVHVGVHVGARTGARMSAYIGPYGCT